MYASRRVSRIGLLCLAVLLAFFPLPAARAQKSVDRPALNPRDIDGMSMGAPIQLGSTWLAHQGDDLQWAQPGYDDSHWQAFNTGLAPVAQGMKDVNAIWYRTHVHIPATARNLALMTTIMLGSDEFFINGVRIGGWGAFTGEGRDAIANQYVASVPNSALRSGDLVIAVRARAGRSSHRGDFPGAGISVVTQIYLGPAKEIAAIDALQTFRNYTSNATNLTLVLLVLLITVALALTVRGEPEYHALAIALLCMAGIQIQLLLSLTRAVPTTFWTMLLQDGMSYVETVALIEFVRIVLGLRRSRWFTVYYALLALWPAADIFNNLWWIPTHALSNTLSTVLGFFIEALSAPATMGLPLLALWIALRRRSFDALLLSVPLLISASFEYYAFAVYLLFMAHAVSVNAIIAAQQTPIHAFNIGWREVVSFAFSLTLLVFLVVRTIRLARYRARAASELHAVKTLQGLLLSRSRQATPGYTVDTAYRPAAEVGGDFFLVSPSPDGSIVAIVGDVSGKGLLAAMRVSLILGALNRESSRQPAEVLARLNQVLLGQGDMGFTTACCVRVESSGDFSFSNAGHLNPYIDGKEIEAPGVLPLGLKPDQTYSTVSGHLNPSQRLVLLSDGVPEARAKRQLLGFDKLVELTRLGASEIADAAQNFGQEDDITVLALALA